MVAIMRRNVALQRFYDDRPQRFYRRTINIPISIITLFINNHNSVYMNQHNNKHIRNNERKMIRDFLLEIICNFACI